MTHPKFSRKIDFALCGLIALDLTLAITAFVFPQTWFQVLHGVPYNDVEGFLRRCGANWAAFALFQAIGLLKWKRQPAWLAIVAGLRFGDIFTDWTYLWFAQDMTWLGKMSLFVSSPGNLLLGLFFLRSYKKCDE